MHLFTYMFVYLDIFHHTYDKLSSNIELVTLIEKININRELTYFTLKQIHVITGIFFLYIYICIYEEYVFYLP